MEKSKTVLKPKKYKLENINDNKKVKKINNMHYLFNKNRKNEINQLLIELIEEIRKIKLPISIVYYDLSGEELKGTNIDEVICVKIRFEHSNKWPSDENKVKAIKTLLYLEIYKKLKHRYHVEENLLLCRYKNKIFRIIIENKDVLDDTSLGNFIKDSNYELKNGIKLIKYYLSFLGYYPNYISDKQIDILALRSLKKDAVGIFNKFLALKHLDYSLDMNTGELVEAHGNIDLSISERLLKMNKDQQNIKTLNPRFHLNYDDFSFVLSENPKKGFKKVEKKTNKFLLGRLNQSFGLDNLGYFLYSEVNRVLMVKIFDKKIIKFVYNIVLAKTSFKYIKIIEE